MDRVVFSSDQLPPGLSDHRRFKAWSELYNDGIGVRGDLQASEAPFDAEMTFVRADSIVLGRASVTVARSDHGGKGRAKAADEERIGLLVNTSEHPFQANQRGREEVLAPGGSILLTRADRGRFEFNARRASWVVIDMPRLAITRAAPGAEDLVGGVLSAGSDALRMVPGYVGLVFREMKNFADGRLDAHVAQTVLDLVALAVGAERDAADIARGRGLRAARLEAVFQAIAKGFADPAFSTAKVARGLGLSERYIQELLHTTGVSFAERVMELRLQRSVSLLARTEATRQKVSDVALACGFSDLSYFHRCFRRRFGMTPAGARAT